MKSIVLIVVLGFSSVIGFAQVDAGKAWSGIRAYYGKPNEYMKTMISVSETKEVRLKKPTEASAGELQGVRFVLSPMEKEDSIGKLYAPMIAVFDQKDQLVCVTDEESVTWPKGSPKEFPPYKSSEGLSSKEQPNK